MKNLMIAGLVAVSFVGCSHSNPQRETASTRSTYIEKQFDPELRINDEVQVLDGKEIGSLSSPAIFPVKGSQKAVELYWNLSDGMESLTFSVIDTRNNVQQKSICKSRLLMHPHPGFYEGGYTPTTYLNCAGIEVEFRDRSFDP